MHVANRAFAPFQEFATGHPERDLGGQRLLRSGQYSLLHRDDAEWAAAVSGCCHGKKARAAAAVAKFNPNEFHPTNGTFASSLGPP